MLLLLLLLLLFAVKFALAITNELLVEIEFDDVDEDRMNSLFNCLLQLLPSADAASISFGVDFF